MNSSDIKQRLKAMSERIIADFNEFNHLVQFDRKLDEAEKIIQYMEDKHILRLEKAKAQVATQDVIAAPVKKKVSKKKAAAKAPVDYVVSDESES
jgi:hypothetical protein